MNKLTLVNEQRIPSSVGDRIDDKLDSTIYNQRAYDLAVMHIHVLSHSEWQRLENAVEAALALIVLGRKIEEKQGQTDDN